MGPNPHDADIYDIGDADNGDVSVGGAGSSAVGCGANAESFPTIDARAVPLPSFDPPRSKWGFAMANHRQTKVQ